jgi:hypothetical protein
MRRLLPLALVLAAVGCGPGGVPPTAAPTSPGTPQLTPATTAGTHASPAARKTFTRAEVEKWLKPAPPAFRSPADVKAKYGAPDQSREVRVRGNDYLEYTYSHLSVDAEGSEKVDSMCVILFHFDQGKTFYKVEFVP